MAAISIALSAALPAWSANVVDVRVGRHAEFTRVVFELDAPAGYSLQRNVPGPGISELVVSLDALAEPRNIKSTKGMIRGVAITPKGSKKSVAHIRLSRDGLRVKEMILASPPRIVLDVLGPPQPKAAASKSAASKAKPKAAAPAPVVTTKQADSASKSAVAPKPVAPEPKQTARVPKVVAKPEAAAAKTPQPAVKATGSAAKATQPAGEATALTGGVAPQASDKKAEVPSGVSPVAAVDPAKSAPPTARAAPQKLAMAKPPVEKPASTRPASTPGPAVTSTLARAAKPAATTVPPPAREKRAAPKPAPARNIPPPAPAEDSMFDMKTIGGGIAALAFVGLVGLLLIRRRASHEVLDEDDFGADPLAADNPFAELGDDLAVGGGTQPKLTDSVFDDEAETSSSLQEDLFGAAPAQADTGAIPQESGAAGENMDTMSNMKTTPMMDGAAAMAGAGAAGDEVMSMLRAFEQRISGLETKLAEVSEAKERLERQVAAQTEELRVQRAAIARTQRAVRNLNRPEDEAPTEPALRDPSRPGSPRTDE